MSAYFLPKEFRKVYVPPVKCQGIKTKMVPFIAASICWEGKGRWVEPFLGSGVVAFNIRAKRAKLSDTNKHIIDFYKAIQENQITEQTVSERLREMGTTLKERGDSYFYEVRERFNESGDPLDLLFLNRSCFNGVMRFNRKGRYNVPFGKKVERFRQAYITKICNQVKWLRTVLHLNDWQMVCQDWRDALQDLSQDDFVYLDPPYIGRHTDYFNSWTEDDACELAKVCKTLPCGFAVSMWKENKYRTNTHIDQCWAGLVMKTFSHFYHVGSTESLRNQMTEALIIREDYAASQSAMNGMVKRKAAKYPEELLFD